VPTIRVGQAEDDVTWQIIRRPSLPSKGLVVNVDGAYGRYPALELQAPSYQAPNVACAIATAEAALGRALDCDRMKVVLGALTFPGRFEFLRYSPPLVIDGAHNCEAAAVLAEACSECFGAARPVIVLGILAG